MLKKNAVKVISVITSGLLALNMGVSAKIVIDSMNFDDGNIIVKGQTDLQNKITYMVYPENKKVSVDVLAALGDAVPGESGAFEFETTLKKSGSYTLTVHDGVSGYDSVDFSFVDEEGRNDFADKISELETADDIKKELLDEKNKNVIEALGIDYTYYTKLDEALQLSIATQVAKADKVGFTPLKFIEAYNLGLNLVKINTMSNEEVVFVLDSLDYSFENVKYTEITDEAVKIKLAENIKANGPYSSYAEIEKEYKLQNALYIISNSKSSNVYDNVTTYATDIEIDGDSDYIKFKNKKSIYVNKKLAELLSDNPVINTDDLLEYIEEALKEAGSGSGSGSGGGGGGSSPSTLKGSGGSSDGSFTVPPETKTEADEVISPAAQSGFSDISEAKWAEEAVNALAEMNVISGYGDGSFKPNNYVTREEFVKMLVTAFDIPYENASNDLIDVFYTDWFYPYISGAYEAGIVKGDSLKLFGIKKQITREDASVMAGRAMEYKGIEKEKVRDYTAFADENVISDYALENVKALYTAGKINGFEDGSFKPKNPCTRAEAVKIIYELIK